MTPNSAQSMEDGAKLLFKRWLASAAAERTEKLLRWFQNYEEAAGWGDEPYLWVLAGVPGGAAKVDAEKALADSMAALLAQQPDVAALGSFPEQLLHNLLSLAASIHQPEVLWVPLCEIYKRRELAGHFGGSDLRASLRAALVANQGDDFLSDVWLRMGTSAGDEFLPGNALHGFYGILMLPPENGRPSSHLGQALAAAARYLEPDVHLRRPRFLELIDRLRKAFPKPGAWGSELFYMADEHCWPDWTMSCIWPPSRSQDHIRYVPRFLRIAITARFGPFAHDKPLWTGRIHEMKLSDGALQCFEAFRHQFEANLKENPYPSDGAWVGELGSTLTAFVRERGHPEETRREILRAYVRDRTPLSEGYLISAAQSDPE